MLLTRSRVASMAHRRYAAQVEQIIRQMEAAQARTSEPQTMSPVRRASALVTTVTRALRGDMPRDGVREELAQLGVEGPLQALVAALIGVCILRQAQDSAAKRVRPVICGCCAATDKRRCRP